MRDTLPPDLAKFYEGVLASPALKELWDRNYPSRKGDDPLHDLQHILDGQEPHHHHDDNHHDCDHDHHHHDHDHDHEPHIEVDDKTQFQVFMREMIRVEYGALGKPKEGEDEDKAQLRKMLGRMYHMFLEADLPAAAALSREQRMMIDVLERQTLQKPFRPIKAMWDSIKHTAHHIKEDAVEHPVLFSGLMVACTAVLLFMNRDLKSQTMYVDPRMLQMDGLSLDALETGGDIVINQGGAAAQFIPTCHDHLVQIMGKTLADMVQSAGDMTGLVPKHCTKLMSGAQDAQVVLGNVYDFVTGRLAIFIETPAVSLGESLPNSYYMQAFVESAKANAQIVYVADTIENVMLHSTIFLSSALATYAYGSLDKGEAAQLKRQVSDFFQRSLYNRPLNYLFSVAATAGIYAYQGQMTLETAWAGVGGLALGHVVHDVHYRMQRNEHVNRVLEKAMTPLKDLAASVQNILPADVPSVDPHFKRKLLTRAQTIAALTALGYVGINGGLLAGDVSGTFEALQPENLKNTMIALSEHAGAATAAAIVWVSYLIINIPQDALQHVIFGTAGVGVALPFVWARKGTDRLRKALGLPEKKRAVPSVSHHHHHDHD